MACLLTLTLLEITFSMLDLGEAKRDRITDVSSLVLVVSLLLLNGLLPSFLMVVEGPTRSWSHQIHNLRFIR